MNRVGEGNRQKKGRTEDLDLSAVVRIASETIAPGHKGGSDSELSGGLTDEEFDLSREFWSWKFWSAGPKFSLENVVRLCKNWSGLKTPFYAFFHEYNTTRQQFNKGQPWQLSTHLEKS